MNYLRIGMSWIGCIILPFPDWLPVIFYSFISIIRNFALIEIIILEYF